MSDSGARPHRSGSEKRRREFQVSVRLTPGEFARLHFDRIETGLSAGELLRRAYFGEEGAADDGA